MSAAPRAKPDSRAASVPNFFRTPYGPGWALVGDAGYTRTRSPPKGSRMRSTMPSCVPPPSPSCSAASRAFDDAMSHVPGERATHACCRCTSFTTQMATLEAPPPEMQQLLGAIHGDREAMDSFVSITAGTVSPVEFFDPDNIGRLMGAVQV